MIDFYDESQDFSGVRFSKAKQEEFNHVISKSV